MNELKALGVLQIIGGIIYYFYRKQNYLSEQTLRELEDDSIGGGLYAQKEFGFVIAFIGLVFLITGFFV